MSAALSDYNRSNYTAQVIAGKVYQDIATRFIHPQSGDALRATDLDAIRNSIKNIILTPIGTRPFFPEFGTKVGDLLFELGDNITAREIKKEIEKGLEKYEPRISNVKVDVVDDSDRNAYNVTVEFRALYGGLATVEFILNRIR